MTGSKPLPMTPDDPALDDASRGALAFLPKGWTVTREVRERLSLDADRTPYTETKFRIYDADGDERATPSREYRLPWRDEPGVHVVRAGMQVSEMGADEATARAVGLLLAALDCGAHEAAAKP